MNISIPYYEDMSRISNSNIGWYLKYGPSYLHERLSGNIEEDSSVAMSKGTMIHMYILQPDEFKKTYKVSSMLKPQSEQQKKFCEELHKTIEIEPNKAILSAYKAAYKVNAQSDDLTLSKGLKIASELKDYIDSLNSDYIIITPLQLKELENIRNNIVNHKLANELIYKVQDVLELETHHEFHINWEDIVPCKSLLDACTFDFKNKICDISDLKTTVHIGCFEESVKQYDYFRQFEFYSKAVKWYIKNELNENTKDWKINVYIIAIDTIHNNEVRVFKLTDKQLKSTDKEINKALTAISWHIKNNEWTHNPIYYENEGYEILDL